MPNCWLVGCEALGSCWLWKCHEPSCKTCQFMHMWWCQSGHLQEKTSSDIHQSPLAWKCLGQKVGSSRTSLFPKLVCSAPQSQSPSPGKERCLKPPQLMFGYFPLRQTCCGSSKALEAAAGQVVKSFPFGCVAFIGSAFRACCPSKGAVP